MGSKKRMSSDSNKQNKNEKKLNMTAKDYLNQPYARVIIPDEDGKTFTASISEFPGCVTEAETRERALEKLEETAENWIRDAIDCGCEIPLPYALETYSGRVALRMAKSLHRKAAEKAKQEGVSVNQFLVNAISESVGAKNRSERRYSIDYINVHYVFSTIGTHSVGNQLFNAKDGQQLRLITAGQHGEASNTGPTH